MRIREIGTYSGFSMDEESDFRSDNSEYKNIKIKKLTKEQQIEIYRENLKNEFLVSVVKCKIRKESSLENFESHMFEESYYYELMTRLKEENIDFRSLKKSTVEEFISNELKIQSELFNIDECPVWYLSNAYMRIKLNEMDNDFINNSFDD